MGLFLTTPTKTIQIQLKYNQSLHYCFQIHDYMAMFQIKLYYIPKELPKKLVKKFQIQSFYYINKLNMNRKFPLVRKRHHPINFIYKTKIALIQQFHIPSSASRYEEIKDTLKKNVNNQKINNIYLLNEKIYTPKELGFENTIPNKIKQFDISNRLTYKTALFFARTQLVDTFVIISNNDIYYDDSIS